MSLINRAKTLFLIICACCPALGAGAANAADPDPYGYYISVHTGYAAHGSADTSLPGDPASGTLDLDGNVSFSAAAGLKLRKYIRVEGEVSYRRPDADDAVIGAAPAAANGDITTWALMLNTYYDFRPGKKLNPYVSAGIGAAHHSGDLSIAGTRADDTDTTFAWAAGAGVSYAVSDRLRVTGGYRYFDTGNPDFGSIRTEVKAHEFRIGLTWKLTPVALER